MPIGDRIGGFIRPGFNPLLVPDAPTIGTASNVGTGTTGSITFTAPSDVGGGAITSYEAVATERTTFVVTVGGGKFVIDGVSQDTLTLQEGGTYTFDQSAGTNSTHPLRLSTTSDGTHGGGSEYTTGVTTNGTPGSAGAYTRIVVASGAPTLYYYCSNHSGMGGTVNTTTGATSFTATGTSSPITITGLILGQTYTVTVAAINAYGPSGMSAASGSFTTSVVEGQQAYTSSGSYSWVAPAGVSSISVVVVGAGGGGGGGGGLAYQNTTAVTPGVSYNVEVGLGGNNAASGGGGQSGTTGGLSSFTAGYGTTTAGGGVADTSPAPGGAPSGTYTAGHSGGTAASKGYNGGGAAGYSGNGGGTYVGGSYDGAGGGGGGGNWAYNGGGGVGILGEGSSGSAGGNGGSGGGNGSAPTGGNYGGGGAGHPNGQKSGADGAVRIIWPGGTRYFPSTNTADV
jgi:hypothetical protein